MSCFILKRHITEAVYSIRHENKPAIIAFTTKKQAGTYRRLINEMQNHKHSNQLKSERIPLESIKRMCNMSSLDLVVYDEDQQPITYSCKPVTIDDMRFHLENRFRYF